MKLKKIEKNILIGSLSVLGIGAVVGTSLAVTNQIKPKIEDPLLSQDFSNEVFQGTILTKADLQKIGWDRKKSISLADWAKQAPNVTQLGSGDSLSAPFYANNSLESIEIPTKITNINNSTFYSTPSLKKVSFEEGSQLIQIGNKAFNNSAIEEISVPVSVKSIGEDAFRNTTNLAPEKIFLPESVRGDLENPLYGLAPDQWEAAAAPKVGFDRDLLTKTAVEQLGWLNKTEITLEDWKQAPNVNQISPDITSGNGTTGAFSNLTKLKKITIPARVQKINYCSFWKSGIQEVNFEAGSQLRIIGRNAFFASPLQTIDIPYNLESILDGAFKNTRLASITIPFATKTIGNDAFYLTYETLEGANIRIPSGWQRPGIPRWGFNDFQWATANYVNQYRGSTLVKANVVSLGWSRKRNITLNDWLNDAPNVTTLVGDTSGSDNRGDKSAFSGNAILETIAIPDKVVDIQFASFARTSALKTVTFGKNSRLTTIGQYAFDGSNINSIIIPGSVITVKHWSFANTNRLGSVTFAPNSRLKLIEWSAFQDSAISSIYIPESDGLVMHDDIFKNTRNLRGENVSMPDALRVSANQNRYGFTNAQWNAIVWRQPIFGGTYLDKTIVSQLGWDKKTTITLEDWKRAPNVVELGNPSINSGLGDQAPFSFNNILQSIQIPAKITKFNFAAFHKSTKLQTITFENGSQLQRINGYAFRESSIATLALPNKVQIIEEFAFNQSGITNLTLPDSLTRIDNNAFDEAKKLTSIRIPAGVTTLGTRVFKDTTSMRTIVFAPNSKLQSIGTETFWLSAINSIEIPKSVRTIGRYSFLRARQIRNFTFEKGSQLTTLGHRPFQEVSFTSLVLPTSLANVESQTFTNSGSIIDITMSSKLRKASLAPLYGMNDTQWSRINWIVEPFTGPILTKNDVINLNWWNKPIISLADWQKVAPNVTSIGRDVASGNIGESPFANNTTIKEIVIPSKITNIGFNAFSGSSLTKITFQDGSKLSKIGTQAFDRSKIAAINIPDSVTNIASNAFASTTALAGAQISMSSNLRKGSLTGLYGLTNEQWNAIKWRIQPFKGTILSKSDVINLNWHIKSEITQADWTSLAPSVTKISNFYASSGNYNEAAFFGNKNLTKIFIPAKITQINYSSFNGASNLREIKFQENSQLNLLGVLSFKGTGLLTMDVPDSVTEISFGAFELARNIKTINFNSRTSQLTTVATNAFIQASSLTEMIFPDRTKTIGETIFVGATSLRKIYVPNETTSINNAAFASTGHVPGSQISMLITLRGGSNTPKYGFTPAQWNSIAWRTIPFAGTTLNKKAVEDLGWNLKETITLDDWNKDAPSVTQISPHATTGIGPDAAFSGNTRLKAIAIPDRITKINFGSFYNTTALQSVTFDKSSRLDFIGNAAFRISSLNTITIPASVLEIGNHAFQQSPSFRQIDFAAGSKLVKIGDGAFDGAGISAINVPDSVTTIGVDAFTNTNSLPGQKVIMDIKLKQGSASPLYGFTPAQWSKIAWKGSVRLTDTINASFLIDFKENSNIVNLPPLMPKASNNMTAQAKDAGLSLQFAVGSSATNLIAQWGTAQQVKNAITTLSATKNILRTEMNIFARMYLPSGAGPEQNMIGNVTYNWSKTELKIYDSTAGIVPNLFVAPGTNGPTLTGKFIRAYGKINDNWANSLTAGGNKASAVKVTSSDNSFDMAAYIAMGVNLEISTDNGTIWKRITVLGADTIDASANNKIQFRLNVSDPRFYEITGSTTIMDTTTNPAGIRTKVVEKEVVAKKQISGISAANLITDKLSISGTTHNLSITEDASLYTASGLTEAAAKAIFEIKYSYDGANYLNAAAFKNALNQLRSTSLNNLNLANFKVRYEFTANGLEKYYSSEIANDPDAAANTTKTLVTTNVIKTLDLTSEIANVRTINISGSTEKLIWSGNGFLTPIASIVKVEYGTFQRSEDGVVSYQWSEVMPTELYTNTAPTGSSNFPLAIRFMPKTEGDKVEIGSISNSGAFQAANTNPGYEVDASKLVSVIRVNTTQLAEKLILSGTANNLNGGASSTEIETPAKALVDEIFRNQVKLQYQISTLVDTWLSLDELKQYLTNYLGNYSNETSGILIFSNGTIAGVTIKAKFVAQDPTKYTVISEPTEEVELNTSQIVTSVDLKGYIKVLETQKVTPSGTSADKLGTLTLPSMPSGNTPFGGKTYLQIEDILASSIDIQFRAPGFHGDGWVPLNDITAVNVNNELFIRFVVKTNAIPNIQLSLVTNNDWTQHQEKGFKLKLNLPVEIQVDSANLTKLISLSGDTKNLNINDEAVYTALNTNPLYVGKVKILYTIGTSPIHLDPDNLNKTEFTKNELIALLKKYTIDITAVQKQITAKYALADGVSEEEFIIKDKKEAILTSTNVLLYINKSNYYELASKLSVSGTSSAIIWGSDITELTSELSKGLILQYSTDDTVSVNDANDSNKWTTEQPKTIDPVKKFLAVRMVVIPGYIFEESPKIFRVNTDNVLLVIALQSSNLELIEISGNTRNITFNLDKFNTALTATGIPGQEFIEIQYYFGGTPPASLGIAPGTEWFSAEQITSIFAALRGAKNEKELILLRNSLKARYSLNDAGYATYRMNIDGQFIDGKFPEQPALWKNLVTDTINATFEGYINLDLFNTFTPDNFQIFGSDKKPQLRPTAKAIEMFDFYKDQTTAPFDIYYSKTNSNFTNLSYKLFGATGFADTLDSTFVIDLDANGNPLPIYFKMVPRNGYKVYENNTEVAGGKVITITNFDIQPQITNPLKTAPEIKFISSTGQRFYQGSGSLSVYESGTNLLVDSAFLNKEYPEVKPDVLKLQYHVSDELYTADEIAELSADASRWTDTVPNTLKVGQYVMTRIAINNPKFTLIGGDAMTGQVRVHGLKVHADLLKISPDLTLTNTDIYGYAPLDGQTKIETASLVPDPQDNYLGADIQMSVDSEFYKDASGKIILDLNNIPIIKRDPTGATQEGVYLDDKGKPIIDGSGNTIPIWTIKKGTSVIPAPPLKTGNFRKPQKMIDWSVPGSFTQLDDGVLDWRLFEGQVVRFSFVARVGQGTIDNPDFIFDTTPTKANDPEITLSTIKYIIPTQGITYRFDQAQLKDITYASDDEQQDPFTGASHISSQLKIVKILPDYKEEVLVGTDIEEQVKIDFEDRVQIKMQLSKQNGSSTVAYGSDISQFTGLQNGDVLTISFESKDINFSLPKPIPPLTIAVKGLFVKPLDVNLFKNLRPDFTGSLNGSGAFSIKVTNPNNPTETNEAVLGINQWYEYQVWGADRQLKTAWTRDETKINNLVNGDKVEWKLVNKDGVFVDDYYNTLLSQSSTSEDIKFRVVNVQDRIEQTVQEGIGNSSKLNPDSNGIPNYPENSGWVVSGLKIEITLDQIQQQKFEQALAQFQPTFSGVNKFGSMSSNIVNDESISKEIVIVWYAAGEDGMPRRITDFKDAGLSNGDQVWATIAPSQYAIDNNLIIDESISQMSSKVFVVDGLTTIVNSTTQTLIISLITASSVVLVGIVGALVYMRKNGKLGGNKKF